MEVPTKMNPLAWLRKHIDAEEGSDTLREMIRAFAEELMDAEVDVLCGAGYGERSPERVNSRNGHRSRPSDTRAGRSTWRIPKLRSGSYFPEWLLQPRRRAERALTAVVAQCYLEGVSTRRVEDIVRPWGSSRSPSPRSRTWRPEPGRDGQSLRNRPLDGGPYTYVWLDALVQRVREDGRVQNVAVVVATGVNAAGKREVLGMEVITVEDGAGWTAFLRGLVARGLSGVALVVSDAHEGLKAAIGAVLVGATWQRCRTHAARNLLSKVPRSAQDLVATLVRTIFAQPDAKSIWAQLERVVDQLEAKFARRGRRLGGHGP